MFFNKLSMSRLYTRNTMFLKKNHPVYNTISRFNNTEFRHISCLLQNNKYNQMSKQDKMLIQKANFNLDLLIYHNKHSFLVDILKKHINQSNVNMYYINDLITKMYLSYSIREALDLLSVTKLNNKMLIYYENEYINRYYDNDKLELLFKEIENEIKRLYPLRKQFILLPFYYNIYLNQMK